jgi:NAD(P)-dependent dehydrogenase (short-subunit alcohol dehydrogenase family)
MSQTLPTELLRPGLLQGVVVLLAEAGPVEAEVAAGAEAESAGVAVRAACAELGARVSTFGAFGEGALATDEAAADEAVERALAESGGVEVLVIDAAGQFSAAAAAAARSPHGGAPAGRAALRACLEASWNVTRSVVNKGFLPREHGGRIVFVAPAPDAGEHAEAARAGLENLARTLSVEWARHAITVVTIAPGEDTTPGEVAALTAYLASPAGAYFSGCVLDLGGASGPGGGSV